MNGNEGSHTAIDTKTALDKIGGDMGLLIELSELFCQERSNMLAAVRRALADGNGASARAAAHSLKGSLAVFSAKHAVALAVRLEECAESNQLVSAANILGELQTEVEQVCRELQRVGSAAIHQNGGTPQPATDGEEIS